MTLITPNTDPTTLDDCGKQAQRMVTIDEARCTNWVELWQSCGPVEDADLSPGALQLCLDYGYDNLDDVNEGSFLEGLLDYRTLRDSSGEILEVHLLTAFGGPTMWEELDASGNVAFRLGWWDTRAEGYGNHVFYAMLFEYMCEMVACL